MVRICPKCNKKLGSNDYYFCSGCGEKLPENLCKVNSTVRRVIDFQPEKKEHKEFLANLKPVFGKVSDTLNLQGMLAAFFISVIIVGIFLIVIYYFDNLSLVKLDDKDTEEKSSRQIVSKNAASDLDTNFKSHIFGSDKIADFAPGNLDVYIEAHDLTELLDLFLQVNGDYEDFGKELKEIASDHFSVLITKKGDDYIWTIITLNKGLLTDDDIKIPKLDWLNVEKVGEALIVSTDPEEIENVKDTKEGVRTSLNQNSSYITAMRGIPKSGQVFIMTFSPEGKEFMKEISELSLPENLKKVVDSYNKISNEFIVIY